MEKDIQRVVSRLKTSFALVWVVAIAVFLAGETDALPSGYLAGNIRGTYIFETISILLTATMLPLSLKLFNFVLVKKVNEESLPVALKHYKLWSDVRLVMLAVIIVLGLICYYLTMSKTGGLCALIGLVATLFCVPSDERLRNELHIYKEK